MLRRFIWLVSPTSLSPSLIPGTAAAQPGSIYRLLQMGMPRQPVLTGSPLQATCAKPPCSALSSSMQHSWQCSWTMGLQLPDDHHVAWLMQVSDGAPGDKRGAILLFDTCSTPLLQVSDSVVGGNPKGCLQGQVVP